jgi:hypothetical protein
MNYCKRVLFFFDFSDKAEPQNQSTYTGDEQEDIALLEKLCEEGMAYRYPQPYTRGA